MKEEKKLCSLCGKEIVRTKGANKKAFAYELQRGAHISCIKKHENILRKHSISPNEYLSAVIEGMFLLFPELDETKSVQNYKSRMRKVEEEIEKVFPFLKEKREEKKVEEKKQGEEEGKKANDKT